MIGVGVGVRRHRTGATRSSVTTRMSLASPRRATVRIDTASAADHPAVRRVLASAYLEYANVVPPAIFEEYIGDLTDLDARAEAELLVARVEREVVGTATFYADASAEGLGWPAGWAGVRAVGVDPSFRGLGIARRLMHECLHRAAVSGARHICLHTAAFMPAAVRLYEGLGFARMPRFDFDGAAHFGEGEVAVPVIAYVLPVGDEPGQASSGRSRRSSLTAR
jgi:ribosomal protein S18 acetylase RimI-like enzyme